MPNLYYLKVSLLEPNYPINGLHRILEVKGNVNFYELHELIFAAFDRTDEHLWKFIITRQKSDSFEKLYDCKEQILLPDDFLWQESDDDCYFYQPNTTLDTLDLKEKDYFYYWFDFGDDWVHRIRIEKIEECTNATRRMRLTKKVGDSPSQYRFDDSNGADDTQNKPNIKDANQPNQEFELLLISALMMIATGSDNADNEPVRWGELVHNGVADELVKRNLIKPCVNPDHIVRMTAYGESELVRFMEMVGIIKE